LPGGATSGAARRGGRLRVGIVGGSAKDSLDAHTPVTHPDEARVIQLYDTLATYDTNFRVQLALAEETAFVFVLIPGGAFRLGAMRPNDRNPEGSPNVDPQTSGEEGPVKEVVLAPFFLSKYEMTQGQWRRFTGKNPSQYGAGATFGGKKISLLNPVEQVSWEDCQEVLGHLGLVLPTEAQWEYAARAGTGTVWWTGDKKETLQGAANLADGFARRNGAGGAGWTVEDWMDDGYLLHAPVGSFKPNGFGLHDVAGNVHEWCRDWYGEYDMPVRPGDGERRVPVREVQDRVIRGGSYGKPAVSARSAYRGGSTPGYGGGLLGLRPAMVITK